MTGKQQMVQKDTEQSVFETNQALPCLQAKRESLYS